VANHLNADDDPAQDPDPGFLKPDADDIQRATVLSLSRSPGGIISFGGGLC